jgi:hypothetical protein
MLPERIRGLCVWLQELPLSGNVRESEWLFPTIETVHVLALVLVVGSICAVDLRLLGLRARQRPFSQIAREMLPWTWSAFCVAAAAGLLMFASKAVTYAGNLPFQLKMLCLLLAGLNMAAFHWIGYRRIDEWDAGKAPPGAKFAGAASLTLWVVIVAAGRWIGFTT